MPRNDGKWFWVVFVSIPCTNLATLRENARGQERQSLAIQTRVIDVARYHSREPRGVFGVSSFFAASDRDAVCVKWFVRKSGRRPKQEQNIIVVGRQNFSIQFDDHAVLVAVFETEAAARQWASDRHKEPLPQAA